MQFQKISILHGRLFVLHLRPPGNSSLFSYIASKNVAFKTPLPLGISKDLPWDGNGFFLEPHNNIKLKRKAGSKFHNLIGSGNRTSLCRCFLITHWVAILPELGCCTSNLEGGGGGGGGFKSFSPPDFLDPVGIHAVSFVICKTTLKSPKGELVLHSYFY